MCKKLIQGNACDQKWGRVLERLEEPSDHSVRLTPSVGKREGEKVR